MNDSDSFIQKNKFPPNGKQLTLELVKKCQAGADYEKNKMRIFEINARCIYMLYKQCCYNQSKDSVMSFLWEGLDFCLENFDINHGMPFYGYWMQYVRGLLQKNYNYNEFLIHIPINGRGKNNENLAQISDIEFQSNLVFQNEDNISEEIENLRKDVARFMNRKTMSSECREIYEIVIKSLDHKNTIKELGISYATLKNYKKKFIIALRKYLSG